MPIDGTNGNDTLTGTAGDDIINGLGGNDTIDGGDGNDIINGGSGVDNLSGGNGDDTFIEDTLPSVGDTFNGGAGTDTIELRILAGSPAPFLTSIGLLSPHAFNASTLISIERLVFASQPGHTVQGVLGYSTWAATGLTQIVGGGGRDVLSIAVGPAAGTYTMPNLPLSGWDAIPTNAWEGGDFVVLSSAAPAGTGVTLNALTGAIFLQVLAGGTGDDILNGTDNADSFEASRGADQVNAGGGNDAIIITNSAPSNGTGWLAPTTFTGAGGFWDGGAGTDVISIGGTVNLQAFFRNIEGVILQPAVVPATPISSRQDPAYLILDQSHLNLLPTATFFGGTGTVEINLDPAMSFNGSQFTFLGGSAVNFRINAGDGNGVSVTGTTGSDTITLGIGNQSATGGAGADVFSMGNGTQTITDFTLGQDLVDFSGSGFSSMARVADFLVQQAGGAALVGDSAGSHHELRLSGVSAGSLTAANFILDTGNYLVIDNGTAFADIQFGLNLDDTIHGGDGADRIYSGGGADRLYGDAGNDLIILDGAVNPTGFNGPPIFDGGAGQDALVLRNYGAVTNAQYNLFFASAPGGFVGIESVQFDSRAGELLTGVLTLTQVNNSGLTAVTGGAGTDQFIVIADSGTVATMPNFTVSNFTGGVGGDIIGLAVVGNNTAGMTLNALQGASFTQVLLGAGGADTLNGSSAFDVLRGNGGDDTLDGKAGADWMYGGLGNDTYYVDQQGDLVFENAGEGTDTIISTSNFYLYQEVENLTLAAGAGNLFGVGNELANTITGNEGDNLLLGGLGDDNMSGGAGGDILYGESGADVLDGGDGVDYLIAGIGNDTLDGGNGTDALYGEDGNDTLTGGADFATDIFYGGTGDDAIYANSGLGDYDIMNGAAGNDTYYVDTPDDIIYEGLGEGTDTVYANISGAGYYLWANVENCVLQGTTPFAAGNELDNVLTGSDSANWLLGNDGNDTLNGKGGNDVLFGDRPGGTAGHDTFVFEANSGQDVIGDFHHGEDTIRLIGSYADFTQLSSHFSQNGSDGAIDLGGGNFIVLNGVTMSTLTASDFLFA